MNTLLSNQLEVGYLSNLLVRCSLAYSAVEARLFIRALNNLFHPPQSLTFQLAFDDIIPGGNQDGRQYAQLSVAAQRLMQAVKDKTSQPDGDSCQYLLLLSTISLDPGTEQIRGKFNPDLKAQLLNMGSRFTPAELETLLMRR